MAGVLPLAALPGCTASRPAAPARPTASEAASRAILDTLSPPVTPTVARPVATAPAPRPVGGGAGTPSGPRPFAEVVRGMRADEGLVTLHRSDTKLLFQIPDTLFGRDLLWLTRVTGVPAGLDGFTTPGINLGEQVVRFERRGDRVLLRKVSFGAVAADSLPIARAVESGNFAPILASLPVQARGADSSSVVVDVTALYEKDVPAFGGLSQQQRTAYAVRRLDESRSFINTARSFPRNVEVNHTLTYEAGRPPSDAEAGTVSVELQQSLVLLPKTPMRPRIADERVGFFTTARVNFGLTDQQAATERFIQRWRLEPRDPAAYARGELVEPVTPIVYYLDPATPAEWRSCVMQGVNDWRGPFETAGFKNAIEARLPPTDDPEWSADDVRYSSVRWAASLTRNAMGPSVADPRSGEIIESDIVWYHNHLRSYRNRILLETGAANPLARRLPIDDGLMCEAMRQVIAHEIGHALGFPHNMGASSAYPVDSLRSRSFVQRMGIAPSLMDYARQNYVAQPGDGLVGDDFLRQMGPYDHYAVNWGYRVIPGAATPEAERPTLHRWILEKAGDPVYRFNGGGSTDPSAQTEDVGNDPVAASAYGIANLKRVAPQLRAWTARPGDDYTDLAELHGELVGQWARYVGHVVTLVGGVVETHKATDQPGAVYADVPAARQRAAVRFLGREVFEAPLWLVPDDVLGRIEGAGALQRVGERQAAVLAALLDPARMQRLAEAEERAPRTAYTPAALLADVRAAVWTAGAPDAYRRALQRAHVERLAALLAPPAAAPSATPPAGPGGGQNAAAVRALLLRSDALPLVRAELAALEAEARHRARGGDALARAHFADLAARAARALRPAP